jgi:hypothetical protein
LDIFPTFAFTKNLKAMGIYKWIKSLFCPQKKNIIRFSPDDYAEADAFVKTWSLEDFSKKHGKMQLCQAPDKNNRESYLKCRFIKDKSNITYVFVSSRMQKTTKEEISQNKEKIRVGQLPNGKYVLYDFRWKDWEDVDL